MREWLYRRFWRVRRVRTQEQAMRSIRDHYRALGIPVDDITDNQLLDGIKRFGQTVRAVGVSASVAAENMAAAFHAMNQAQLKRSPASVPAPSAQSAS